MSDRIWTRIAAAGGILYVVLTLLGNDVLGTSSGAPGITATGAKLGAYVRTHPPTALSWAALYIELLGILAFVFFLGSLWSVLRRAEGEHGPFSAIAFGAGLVSVGVKIASFPAAIAAFYRGQEGMDSQLAAALLDMNGVSFVLTWAIDAALLAATAVVVLSTGALPRWLGWSAAVLSGALDRGGVRNILWLRPLRANDAVDSGDEHRFDPPCRRSCPGQKGQAARGNHVGPLGALIRGG